MDSNINKVVPRERPDINIFPHPNDSSTTVVTSKHSYYGIKSVVVPCHIQDVQILPMTNEHWSQSYLQRVKAILPTNEGPVCVVVRDVTK